MVDNRHFLTVGRKLLSNLKKVPKWSYKLFFKKLSGYKFISKGLQEWFLSHFVACKKTKKMLYHSKLFEITRGCFRRKTIPPKLLILEWDRRSGLSISVFKYLNKKDGQKKFD